MKRSQELTHKSDPYYVRRKFSYSKDLMRLPKSDDYFPPIRPNNIQKSPSFNLCGYNKKRRKSMQLSHRKEVIIPYIANVTKARKGMLNISLQYLRLKSDTLHHF